MQSFYTCANLLSILEINLAHYPPEWNQAIIYKTAQIDSKIFFVFSA